MSNIVARNFFGLGVDLNELDISNERPDGRYLDEQLSSGLFTCISSGGGCLYFGMKAIFPWEEKIYGVMPKDEDTAKDMIAHHLVDYLLGEKKRIEDDGDDYEDYIPTLGEITSKIKNIDDSWTELW